MAVLHRFYCIWGLLLSKCFYFEPKRLIGWISISKSVCPPSWSTIAQLVECLTSYQEVAGSNPTVPGPLAKSVTCLTTDNCLTADPGAASSIPAYSHTFVEIDHEMISTAILLPSTDSRRVVVSYKRMYVH